MLSDAAGAPLNNGMRTRTPFAKKNAIEVTRADSCLQQLSPGVCQPGVISTTTSRPQGLRALDAAARKRAPQMRVEDTIDIMQRVPAYKVPFKPAYNAPSSPASPDAPARRSSVLPAIQVGAS